MWIHGDLRDDMRRHAAKWHNNILEVRKETTCVRIRREHCFFDSRTPREVAIAFSPSDSTETAVTGDFV